MNYTKSRNNTIVFLIAFCILFIFYHQVILSPNSYLFAPGGDGIKNYYAYMFHAKHDSSFWNFGGMNYPYYEHMVYTDGHPLLSYLVGKFGLVNYGIGILNFLMLISIPLCALFIYKILNHFQVKTLWAIIASIVIAFMSPQIFRISGHLSLSYMFAIPMLWWLLIWFAKDCKWYKSMLIAIYILFFFFTHPYLGLILISFAFTYYLVQLILIKPRNWKNLIHLFVQCIIPVIIFQGLVVLTDTHEGRLGEPAGFFDYYASWKSVFVPHSGPLIFFTKLFKIDVGNWESWNYVGFSIEIFTLIILYHVIKNRNQINIVAQLKSELGIFSIAAFLILMFAFCFPLKYGFLRNLVDAFGPLKQFRVLGRFGWVFFYVFSCVVIVLFYRMYLKSQKKRLLEILFYSAMLFTILEFYPVHRNLSKVITHSPNVFQRESLTNEMNDIIDFIENDNPDVLLVLPFQHMSSENVMILGEEKANYDSFLLSYHTGKPLMNSVSSRMSLDEAIKFNNFFSPEFIEKELLYDFREETKILVVKNTDGANKDELRIIYTTEDAYSNSEFKTFYFNREKYNSPDYFNEVMSHYNNANYELKEGWFSDTVTNDFMYLSFDELKSSQTFNGNGALSGTKEGYDKIAEINSGDLPPGNYFISFWYYILVDRPDVSAVAEQDSVGDVGSNWYSTYEIFQSNHIVNGWCHVLLPIEISSSIELVNILITGNGNGKPFFIDELLIYPANSKIHLFKNSTLNNEDYVIYNNYYLKKNSFNQTLNDERHSE